MIIFRQNLILQEDGTWRGIGGIRLWAMTNLIGAVNSGGTRGDFF